MLKRDKVRNGEGEQGCQFHSLYRMYLYEKEI